MYHHKYLSVTNCDGPAASTTKLSEIYNAYQYVEYCDLSTCKYVKSRTYARIFDNDIECDDESFQNESEDDSEDDSDDDSEGDSEDDSEDDNISRFREELYVDGYCNAVIDRSFRFSCDDQNGNAIKTFYHNDNCDGNPYHVESFTPYVDCVKDGIYSQTSAMHVTCGDINIIINTEEEESVDAGQVPPIGAPSNTPTNAPTNAPNKVSKSFILSRGSSSTTKHIGQSLLASISLSLVIFVFGL